MAFYDNPENPVHIRVNPGTQTILKILVQTHSFLPTRCASTMTVLSHTVRGKPK